jgi:capping protein beta
MTDQLDCILDLCRRLPPSKITQNLAALVELVPADLKDEILSSVDVPLTLKNDSKAAKSYLICDYNKDGDSYRLVLASAFQ